MTLPPLPDLREAFEAYFANSRRGRGVKKIPVFKRLPDDSYADEPTQRHWWTWQNAARAAIAAHVPEAGCGNIAAVPASLTDEQIDRLIQWQWATNYQQPLYPAARAFARAVLAAAQQAVPVPADMALTDDPWRKLYRRAINEANGLTNYVEDRPELRGAERRLAATFEPTPEKKP